MESSPESLQPVGSLKKKAGLDLVSSKLLCWDKRSPVDGPEILDASAKEEGGTGTGIL